MDRKETDQDDRGVHQRVGEEDERAGVRYDASEARVVTEWPRARDVRAPPLQAGLGLVPAVGGPRCTASEGGDPPPGVVPSCETVVYSATPPNAEH